SIGRGNAPSHYPDWTVGHVHSGALGWSAFITFGMLYYIVPVLWSRQRLYPLKLVSLHFWIATLGILLYITSMWVSGIMEGLMWRTYNEFGFLEYSFVETVSAKHISNIIRVAGGSLFLLGALIMVYNLVRTARGDVPAGELRRAPVAPNIQPAE